MSLLDRIKGTLGGDDEGDEPGFNYHCRECGAEFEAAESSRSNVDCPVCNATGTRSIARL